MAVYGIQRSGTIDLPVFAWLLSQGDRHMLVDSGPPTPDVTMARHGRRINCGQGRSLEEQLRRNGVAHGDIFALTMTHLHWDHCSNNDLFPGVPIYVQEAEVRFATEPLPTQLRPYAAFQSGQSPAWVASADRFVILNGIAQIAPGITALPLPGHTPGSQGLLVDTPTGRVCITGDLLDTYENWTGRLPTWTASGGEGPVGIPPGIHTDLQAWYDSVALLRSMKVEVLPAHEWEVIERLGGTRGTD